MKQENFQEKEAKDFQIEEKQKTKAMEEKAKLKTKKKRYS